MKKPRFSRSTAAFAALLLLPLSLAVAPAPAAETPTVAASACSITRESYNKLAPDLVRQVQDALAYFKLYANRIDNIVGIDTRAGLATYCRQRGQRLDTDTSRQALLDELLRDSAVDRVYHDWRGILASEGFAPWAAGQADSKDIGSQTKSGTPAQIIDIIDRYLKRRQLPAKPGIASWADNQTNSYRLAVTDLETLGARRSVLDKLVKMKGAGFQDKTDFFAQINELLVGESEAETRAVLKLVDRYAAQQSVFTLGEGGLARLSAAHVPYDLLADLEEFKDPGFPSRADAEAALRVLLFGTAEPPEKPPARKAGKTGAAATPAEAKPDAVSATDANKSAAENNAKWLPVILVQLEERSAYRLSDEAWSKLTSAAGALPDYVPAILQEIAEVDYPLRELFIKAAEARIGARLKALVKAASADVKQRHVQQVDDKLFATLKKKRFSDELANILNPLKGKTYATESELDKQIKTLETTEITRFASYQEFIGDLARKQHPFDPAKKPMLSPVADCKCLPNTMRHQVYGFYPFWQAGQTQSVDFASLSRLGYYALSFDNDGSLQQPGGDAPEYFGQAFTTVRTYETKVDYVVSRHDWSTWADQSPAERSAAFAKLSADIAKLLGTPPVDTLSRLKPYISFDRHHPSMADGVTLFFEHYPADEDYAREFHDFLDKLRSTLAGSKKTVNLMLPHSALGQGAFTYKRLKDLAPTDDKEAGSIYLLVLLEEPYTDTKKRLRNEVESKLHGADQRNLLRMMIPIIVPDGKAPLDDDIIYMGDNFAGIGFWPLPAPAGEAATRALLPEAPIIKKEYYPENNRQTNAICGIVCPNRWLFRLALDIFLVATLVMLTALARCCECRAGFRQHFIPILGGTVIPLFLLFMALLSCDPSWSKMADGNQPLYLVLLAIILYAIWDYWQRKQEIP